MLLRCKYEDLGIEFCSHNQINVSLFNREIDREFWFRFISAKLYTLRSDNNKNIFPSENATLRKVEL